MGLHREMSLVDYVLCPELFTMDKHILDILEKIGDLEVIGPVFLGRMLKEMLAMVLGGQILQQEPIIDGTLTQLRL